MDSSATRQAPPEWEARLAKLLAAGKNEPVTDKVALSGSAALSPEEIDFVCYAMQAAPRRLEQAFHRINEEFALGPLGAWMVCLLSSEPVFPLEFSKIFDVSRASITMELGRLSTAGLILTRQNAFDGRRTEITLSSRGETIKLRLADELAKMFRDRLSAYTREEILLCARMLRDFDGSVPKIERPQKSL